MKKIFCFILFLLSFVAYMGCGNAEEFEENKDVGNLTKAWDYVQINAKNVNERYRGDFHVSSPVGWMNDPNGFSYALGNYHLFFQHNPYDVKWGPMHWGHYTTKDFIKWELQPTALAPDKPYDTDFGCFSGSALEKNNKMYLLYTGVAGDRQTQCIAESDDGLKFTKTEENPIIDSVQIPADSSKSDFRDPKVFRRDNMYYMLVGSKNNDGDGQILLYRSATLKNWTYVGTTVKSPLTKPGIFECPDYAIIDQKEVLFASPQFYPTDGTMFENVHSVVYMIGNLDYQSGRFEYETVREVDGGFDFYASQTLQTPDGRTIMIAWMQMWDRTMPTAQDGYTGAMILPRELSVKDNKLIQAPVREIEKYRKNFVSYGNVPLTGSKEFSDIGGKTVELDVTFDIASGKTGLKLFCGQKEETLLYYDADSSTLVFDRTNSGLEIKTSSTKEKDAKVRRLKVDTNNGRLQLRVFLDKSSVEVFVNGGIATMTGNVYPSENSQGIKFFSDGVGNSIRSVTKYDIAI